MSNTNYIELFNVIFDVRSNLRIVRIRIMNYLHEIDGNEIERYELRVRTCTDIRNIRLILIVLEHQKIV